MSEYKDIVKTGFALGAKHFRIWEWLNGKIERLIANKDVFYPDSLSNLWKNLFDGTLSHGNYIEFSSTTNNRFWYLTEWVPKSPGIDWKDFNLFKFTPTQIRDSLSTKSIITYKTENQRGQLLDLNFYELFHNERRFFNYNKSKKSLYEQGFTLRSGIYRSLINYHNIDFHVLVSLVTNDEYFIDLGFPIILSKQVYDKFLQNQSDENSVEFTGIVKLLEINYSDIFQSYLKAVGSKEDEDLKELINHTIGIKNFVGYISSPLDITLKSHNSHPNGTFRVDGHDGLDKYKDEGLLLLTRMIVDNPKNIPKKLPKWDFLISEDMQFGTKMIPLNDFDKRIRRFHSSIPINLNPETDFDPVNRYKNYFK